MAGILTAFVLYLLAVLAIGFRFSHRSGSNIEEFYLGGRKLNPFIVALSAVVSGRSAWLILGVSGQAFMVGVSAVWVLPGYILVELWMMLYLARRLRQKTGIAKDITLPDFFESRFRDSSHVLRIVAVVLICVFFTAYVAAQINAGKLAFKYLLNLNGFDSMLLVVAIIGIYTVVGGYLAVTYTDLVQAVLMIFALVALPVMAAFMFFGGPFRTLNVLEKYSTAEPRVIASIPVQAPGNIESARVMVLDRGDEQGMANAGWAEISSRFPTANHSEIFPRLARQVAIEISRRNLMNRKAAETDERVPLLERTWILLPREWPNSTDANAAITDEILQAAIWRGTPADGPAIRDYHRLAEMIGGTDGVSKANAIARLAQLRSFDARLTTSLAAAGNPSAKATGEFDLLAFGALLAILSGLAIGFGSPGNPHILVRYMSIAKADQFRVAALVGTLWNVLMGWGAVYIGLVARAYFVGWWNLPMPETGNNTELAFLALAQAVLPDFFVGLMLAALVAAIMSTVDSQLLVAASGVSRDVYQKLTRRGRDASQRKLVWISRVTVIFIIVLAAGLGMLAENSKGFGKVFGLVLIGWQSLGAAFGPTVILALFWRRMTRNGALAGMITGTVVTVGIKLAAEFTTQLPAELVKLYGAWGFIAATMAIVAVSLLGADPRPKSPATA